MNTTYIKRTEKTTYRCNRKINVNAKWLYLSQLLKLIEEKYYFCFAAQLFNIIIRSALLMYTDRNFNDGFTSFAQFIIRIVKSYFQFKL